jgi:hypothetical protein
VEFTVLFLEAKVEIMRFTSRLTYSVPSSQLAGYEEQEAAGSKTEVGASDLSEYTPPRPPS